MLTLQEDERFYFDEDAAERPCRFIEKLLEHFQGAHAGTPFILHPLQRRIVRDLFGWKWRSGPSQGLRRFTDCWLEAAIGAGKSPLMAAIGLYGLMADGERGAQIYSLASKFSQAKIVFDCAKRFARNSRALSQRLVVVDREIRHPASGSFWTIVGRTGPGAGCSPHFAIGDEVHDWSGAGAYQDLRDRMSKRRQPLFITATNAGRSRASFCWQMREKAVAALAGTGDETLYPVIWAADESARTDDPEAWRAANPLLGVTIAEDKVRRKCHEAMKDEDDEAEFRRLCLGIWPKKAAGGRWLDLALWDACIADEPPPDDAPLYVGLDLSQHDDLSAAVFVSAMPDRMHVASRFWVPKITASRYEASDGIPYQAWADAGYITLVDTPTISLAARREIAEAIIARSKRQEIKAVCYDRYKADETVAALEAAGITCVPIPQGYSTSPGARELERRLAERSLAIATNDVLRWNAENATVKGDDKGNIWVAKPNAAGRYAGTKQLKVDGISALVTALTEARKHSFPAAAKQWKGTVCIA